VIQLAKSLLPSGAIPPAAMTFRKTSRHHGEENEKVEILSIRILNIRNTKSAVKKTVFLLVKICDDSINEVRLRECFCDNACSVAGVKRWQQAGRREDGGKYSQ
jgi:hypothetical protein